MKKYTQAVITALSLVGISVNANANTNTNLDNYEVYDHNLQKDFAAQSNAKEQASPQPQPEQSVQKMQKRTIDKNTRFREDAAFNPPSAYHQGYIDENELKASQNKESAEIRNDNPRQRGEVVNVKVGSGVGVKSKIVKDWLPALQRKGVSKDKVLFEANRLSHSEFVEWANNLYNSL